MGFKEEELGGKWGNEFLISWHLGKGGASRLISQNGNQAFLDPWNIYLSRCTGVRGESLSCHCAFSGWQVPSISQANYPGPLGPHSEQACRPRQTAPPELVLRAGE